MILGAIPARWGSTRFPGKALAEIAGRPLVAWVADSALRAASLDAVVVVTDDERIARAAEAAGARAVVIRREAASGSDRIAQLLATDPECAATRIVVNVQGDEPLLEPDSIDAAVAALRDDPSADLATLCRPLRAGERASDPDLVKVAVAGTGHALYFSRAEIPHGGRSLVHVGLYAFRREAFDRFAATPPSGLERAERLEQLRALEIGLRIRVVPSDSRSIGVDTPADVERVAAILARRSAVDASSGGA